MHVIVSAQYINEWMIRCIYDDAYEEFVPVSRIGDYPPLDTFLANGGTIAPAEE